MECELCRAIDEDYRLILKDEHSFAVIIRDLIKKLHFMVMPIRHVESLDRLTKEESKSIFTLLHKLECAIIKASDEDPIIAMHRGTHSSQKHIHLHIMQSKVSIRKLMSDFENIPFRKQATRQQFEETKKEILKYL